MSTAQNQAIQIRDNTNTANTLHWVTLSLTGTLRLWAENLDNIALQQCCLKIIAADDQFVQKCVAQVKKEQAPELTLKSMLASMFRITDDYFQNPTSNKSAIGDLFLQLVTNSDCMQMYQKYFPGALEKSLYRGITFFTENPNLSSKYSFDAILLAQPKNIQRQLLLQQILWACGSILFDENSDAANNYLNKAKQYPKLLQPDDYKDMFLMLAQSGKYNPLQLRRLGYYLVNEMPYEGETSITACFEEQPNPEPCSRTQLDSSNKQESKQENKATALEVSQSARIRISTKPVNLQFLQLILNLNHQLPRIDSSWSYATHAKIIFGTALVALVGYVLYGLASLASAFVRCIFCCNTKQPKQIIAQQALSKMLKKSSEQSANNSGKNKGSVTAAATTPTANTNPPQNSMTFSFIQNPIAQSNSQNSQTNSEITATPAVRI